MLITRENAPLTTTPNCCFPWNCQAQVQETVIPECISSFGNHCGHVCNPAVHQQNNRLLDTCFFPWHEKCFIWSLFSGSQSSNVSGQQLLAFIWGLSTALNCDCLHLVMCLTAGTLFSNEAHHWTTRDKKVLAQPKDIWFMWTLPRALTLIR